MPPIHGTNRSHLWKEKSKIIHYNENEEQSNRIIFLYIYYDFSENLLIDFNGP